MQPILLYYTNLLLCVLVFCELLFTYRKNPRLKIYFLLMVTSLFTMNYFAIAGIDTRIQFVFARFMRLVYAVCTLMALMHLVNPKIPRWFITLVAMATITITGSRIAYFNDINIKALPNIPNHVFTVGSEFYSPKPALRYLVLGLAITAIVVGYRYYQKLLLKLNRESVQYKHLSWWIISLVVPFFLLAIFGILGNLKTFNESVSSYLFASFSCITICSFVLRPRFVDAGSFKESSEAIKDTAERVTDHYSLLK